MVREARATCSASSQDPIPRIPSDPRCRRNRERLLQIVSGTLRRQRAQLGRRKIRATATPGRIPPREESRGGRCGWRMDSFDQASHASFLLQRFSNKSEHVRLAQYRARKQAAVSSISRLLTRAVLYRCPNYLKPVRIKV